MWLEQEACAHTASLVRMTPTNPVTKVCVVLSKRVFHLGTERGSETAALGLEGL